MPGFGPAAEILLFRQKDPKPLTPRLALSELTDAGVRGADQLAVLRQGPQNILSVRPWCQAAGVGWEIVWITQWPEFPPHPQSGIESYSVISHSSGGPSRDFCLYRSLLQSPFNQVSTKSVEDHILHLRNMFIYLFIFANCFYLHSEIDL